MSKSLQLVGRVVSNGMADTAKVSVSRTVFHQKLQFHHKKHKKYHAFDLGNTCVPGDWVQIRQIPVKELATVEHDKHWELVKILAPIPRAMYKGKLVTAWD